MTFILNNSADSPLDLTHGKRTIFWFRLLWIVIFLAFVGITGEEERWGDVFLLSFFMFACHLILVIPKDYIRPRFIRITFFVADFLFLFWGLLLTSLPFLLFLMFLSAFFLNCFFARNIRFIISITVFYMVLIPISLLQTWIPTGAFLHFQSSLLPLALFEGLIVASAFYLAYLGLPINSQYAVQEKFRQALNRKNLTIRACSEIAECASVNEILQFSHDILLEAVPGCHVMILHIVGDRATVSCSTVPLSNEDFSWSDSSPALKQSMESGTLVTSQYRQSSSWSDAVRELYIPLFHKEGIAKRFFAGISRQGTEFLEEEKEIIQSVGKCVAPNIGKLLALESKTTEGTEISSRLEVIENEHEQIKMAEQLLSLLNLADNLEACLDAIYETFKQFFNSDCLLLFLKSEDEPHLELISARSTDPHQFQIGFKLPIRDTLIGRVFSKNTILLKSSIKEDLDQDDAPKDAVFYSDSRIHSLILHSLAEINSVAPFGVIIVGSQSAGNFKIADLEILGRFSDALGAVILKNLKYMDAVKKLRETSAIYVVGQSITTLSDPDTLPWTLGTVIKQAFNFENSRRFDFPLRRVSF